MDREAKGVEMTIEVGSSFFFFISGPKYIE